MPVSFLRKNPMAVLLVVGGAVLVLLLVMMMDGRLLRTQVSDSDSEPLSCSERVAMINELLTHYEGLLTRRTQELGSLDRELNAIRNRITLLQALAGSVFGDENRQPLLDEIAQLESEADTKEREVEIKQQQVDATRDFIADLTRRLTSCESPTPSVSSSATRYYRYEVGDAGNSPFGEGCAIEYHVPDGAECSYDVTEIRDVRGDFCASSTDGESHVLHEYIVPTYCSEYSQAEDDQFIITDCRDECASINKSGGTCVPTDDDTFCSAENPLLQRTFTSGSAKCTCGDFLPSPTGSEEPAPDTDSTSEPSETEPPEA